MILHLHCVAGRWRSPPQDHHHGPPELRTVRAPSTREETNKVPAKCSQVGHFLTRIPFLIPVDSFALFVSFIATGECVLKRKSQPFVMSQRMLTHCADMQQHPAARCSLSPQEPPCSGPLPNMWKVRSQALNRGLDMLFSGEPREFREKREYMSARRDCTFFLRLSL